MILPELAEALISGGPRFVDFLHEHTDLRLRLVEGYPDYHPEHPGGKPGGVAGLSSPASSPSPGSSSGSTASAVTSNESCSPRCPWAVGRVSSRPRFSPPGRCSGGGPGSCTGRWCPESVPRARVRVETGCRALRLCTAERRVVGVEVETDDRMRTVRARAVVLATGGFEYDPDLVRDFLRGR